MTGTYSADTRLPPPRYPTCQTDVLPQNKPYHSLSGHFLFLLQPKNHTPSLLFFWGGAADLSDVMLLFKDGGGYIFSPEFFGGGGGLGI